MKKALLILLGIFFFISCSSDDNKINNEKEQKVENTDLKFKEEAMKGVKIISTEPLIIESDIFEVVKSYNNETKEYSFGIVRKNNVDNYNDIDGGLKKTIRSGRRDGYLYYNKGGRTCAIYGYYSGDSFTPASYATQDLMNFCYDGMLA